MSTKQTFSFFSLEVYDPEFDASIYEFYLEDISREHLPFLVVSAIDELKEDEWIEIDREYLISYPELNTILNAWTNLPLRVVCEISTVPYRVHTGREIDLMRKRLKPLAAFSDIPEDSNDADFLTKYFDPMIASGELIYSEIIEPEVRPIRLYALPEEEWRIKAYSLMKSTARRTNWNDSLERIEGSLLGYSDEQNDQHILERANRGIRWGRQTVYKFISENEAVFVQQTGAKAFPVGTNSSSRIYLPRYVAGEMDEVEILDASNRGICSRFSVKIVDFFQFPREIKMINGAEFEIFQLSDNDIVYLNNKIDGVIDLLDSHNAKETSMKK